MYRYFNLADIHERYPFLRVPIWDSYDYETSTYTRFYRPEEASYFDSFPTGWWVGFGEQMCEEIRDCLLRHGGANFLYGVRVIELKEKYGALIFELDYAGLSEYDGANDAIDDVEEILTKYFYVSQHTCIECGAKATRTSLGWIAPYCDKCGSPNAKYEPIEEES